MFLQIREIWRSAEAINFGFKARFQNNPFLLSEEPEQCSVYKLITDATRRMSNNGSFICDQGQFGSGTWVRFDSPAGAIMPTSPVSIYMCNTHAPGWYKGDYPVGTGSSTSGTVCYNWAGNTCLWSNAITVTNCGSFYVFYLIDPPYCNLRYCTV